MPQFQVAPCSDEGSQFFGTVFASNSAWVEFDVQQTSCSVMEAWVFGEVVTGMDVVDNIKEQQKDRFDRPINDIKIISVEVVENK